MIITGEFGKIEIIKDKNPKEPINNLNYMLHKLQNKNIEIDIEWEGHDRAEGRIFSDSFEYHSFNLSFYHHYTLRYTQT